MIVITLCGLPGAGKSTLAAALATELRAPVLSKDRVREALFGPHFVEYSRAQDDHCAEWLYSTAGWLSAQGRFEYALLDGRTFKSPGQAERLMARARECGFDPRFVLCTAPREVALARIQHDRSAGAHPAQDRTRARFEALEREARPLGFPHLVVDTVALDLAAQVRRVREWIAT